MDAIDAELTDAAREALRARINDYMTKALREAKLHTSWINVNAPYERGVAQFIDLLLQPSSGAIVRHRAAPLRGRILLPGICNSLAQLVLKATAPGVPDIYQGTELWDLSLVDPDNRRPVDFAVRRALLAELAAPRRGRAARACRELLCAARRRPRSSCWSRAAPCSTAARPRALYDRGGYLALHADGERAGRHVFAFARTLDGTASMTVVGRLLRSLAAGRRPAGRRGQLERHALVLPPALPHGAYRDALTGSVVELDRGPTRPGSGSAQVFANLPVAILEPA